MPRIQLKGMEVDLAGAAAVVAIGALAYALLLHEPLGDALAGNKLQQQQLLATRAIGELQSEYSTRFRRLEQTRKDLDVRARWLMNPDPPAEVLARINEFARQCDVRITRWQPQASAAFAEYQEQVFAIDGAATWPALLQWFALVEEGVPLLDVTNLAVSAPTTPGQGTCEFACSLKLYRGKEKETVRVAAVPVFADQAALAKQAQP